MLLNKLKSLDLMLPFRSNSYSFHHLIKYQLKSPKDGDVSGVTRNYCISPSRKEMLTLSIPTAQPVAKLGWGKGGKDESYIAFHAP